MTAPAKTYNFTQFHQKTGGDAQAYNKYLRYVANYRANKLAHQSANPLNSDALQPIDPRVEIPKLHTMASAQVTPLINASDASYKHDVNAATNSLAGYSKSLASFFQPQSEQIVHNTDNATAAMAGANSALGSTVGGGSSGMDALSHYLGAMGSGASPQQAATQNLGTTSANLLAAHGVNAINDVTGTGIARANTAAFLPTFAAASGRQTLANTLDSYGAAHTKENAGLLAQEPGIFSRLYQSFVNSEIQKAVARNSGYGSQLATGARVAAANTKVDLTTHSETNPTTGKPQTVQNGWHLNAKGIPVKDASPNAAPTSGPGSKRYKDYQTAVSKATTSAKSALAAALRPQSVTKQVVTTNDFGQPIHKTVTVKQRVANYNGTINQIRSIVAPILAPYMGPNDITRWVQQLVNANYAPGAYGRPGKGTPARTDASGGYATHPRP